jgi:hypothetical protein
MYTLNLTHEQQQALQALLECSISDIHSQIVRADSHGFKQALKGRKEILAGMLDALKQVQTAAA